jgi:hypothetical protein
MAGGMRMTGGSISMGEAWDEIRRAARRRVRCWSRPPRESGGCRPRRSPSTAVSSPIRDQGGGRLGIPHGASVSSLACWRE